MKEANKGMHPHEYTTVLPDVRVGGAENTTTRLDSCVAIVSQ